MEKCIFFLTRYGSENSTKAVLANLETPRRDTE